MKLIFAITLVVASMINFSANAMSRKEKEEKLHELFEAIKSGNLANLDKAVNPEDLKDSIKYVDVSFACKSSYIAQIRFRDESYRTALCFAIEKAIGSSSCRSGPYEPHFLESVKLLLDKGVDPDTCGMMFRDLHCVNVVINEFMDSNLTVEHQRAGIPILEMLLNAGANTKFDDYGRDNPLSNARYRLKYCKERKSAEEAAIAQQMVDLLEKHSKPKL